MISCCLLREQTSLKAFWYLARNWKRVREKRREIMKRRRVNDDYMATWFQYTPVSKPLPKATASVAPRYKTAGGSQAEQFEYEDRHPRHARHSRALRRVSRPSPKNWAPAWPSAATR